MDDPAIAPADHQHALRGLARLNRASGIDRTVYNALRPYLSDQPLRVLDVAAGSGDLVNALAVRTGSKAFLVQYTACDISEFACQQVRERAQHQPREIADRIEAVRCDVLNEPLPRGFDIVMCHLFLHHLDGPDIVRLLRSMRESACKAVIISDLRRTRRGYALAWLASRVLTRSPVVHTDAMLSVRAALTAGELCELAISAGYDEPCIRTVWPQRILLTWRS